MSPPFGEPVHIGVGELTEDEKYLAHAPSVFLLAKSNPMVPGEGIEPSWSCPRGILSPVRLPIPPSRRWNGPEIIIGLSPEDSPCVLFFVAFSSPPGLLLPRHPILLPRSSNTIAPTESNSSCRARRRRARS